MNRTCFAPLLIFYIFFAVVLLCPSADGQEGWSDTTPFALTNEAINLYQSIGIYHDQRGDKNIRDIVANRNKFTPNNTSEVYNQDDVYWTTLTLYKKSIGRNSILHFSSNNWNLSWQNIDIWIKDANDKFIHYKSGDSIDKKVKPIQSNLNLLDLSAIDMDTINVICKLAGVNQNRKPLSITYWLINPHYFPGYFRNYPFKGEYQKQTAKAAFGSNPITDFEIINLEDKNYSIENISQNWSSFKKTHIFNSTHRENQEYWIKLTLEGSLFLHGKQYFHISSEQGNDQFSFDYINTYITRDFKTFKHQKTGDKVALEKRPLNFWANFVTLEIEPQDSLDIYIQMRGADSRYIMPHIMLYHVDHDSLFPKQSQEAWRHGIFTGIIGIKFLFFLLLSIVGREKIYFFFSLMSFGFFLVLGFDDNMYSRFVAFPELRNYHILFFYTGLFLSQIGFLNITKIYFNYKNHIVWKYIRIFLIISFFIHLNGFVQLRFISGVSGYTNLPHILVAASILSGILMVIVLAIKSSKTPESSKLLFLSTFLPLTITVLIALSRPILNPILGNDLFSDQSIWANNQDIVKLSIVFMLVMLALTVGRRTIKLKADKATALKIAEKNEIIAAKSQENELLMQEIHHRVKNNLQILSSLLNLQTDHLTDARAIDALQAGRNRVESMGLIHQKLYSNNNISSVHIGDYITDLCLYLEDAFSSTDKQIIIHEDVDFGTMDIEYAIPLGLIINELVTNSVKYAYPNKQQGEIVLTLREMNNQLRLQVSDDGKGIIGMDALSIRNSFGSKLIETLSKKLKGTITIETQNGYSCIILFDRYERKEPKI